MKEATQQKEEQPCNCCVEKIGEIEPRPLCKMLGRDLGVRLNGGSNGQLLTKVYTYIQCLYVYKILVKLYYVGKYFRG
jgi:hypothetical protein